MADIVNLPQYWQKYGLEPPAELAELPANDYRKYLAVTRVLKNEIARLEGTLYEGQNNAPAMQQIEDARAEQERLRKLQFELIQNKPHPTYEPPVAPESKGGLLTADAARRKVMRTQVVAKPWSGVGNLIPGAK